MTPEKKLINATEAFNIWKGAGMEGTYPTFLTLIKQKPFTICPTSRVILIKEIDLRSFITALKKQKEK